MTVNGTNHQSSGDILGIIEQASHSRRPLQIDPKGIISLAEDASETRKSSASKTSSETNKRVFSRIVTAVRRELSRESGHEDTLYPLDARSELATELRRVQQSGILPSAERLKELLARSLGQMVADKSESPTIDVVSIRNSILTSSDAFMANDFAEFVTGSVEKHQAAAQNLVSALTALKSHTAQLRDGYLSNPEPSESLTAELKQFENACGLFEEKMAIARAGRREKRGDTLLGKSVKQTEIKKNETLIQNLNSTEPMKTENQKSYLAKVKITKLAD